MISTAACVVRASINFDILSVLPLYKISPFLLHGGKNILSVYMFCGIRNQTIAEALISPVQRVSDQGDI